MADKDSSEKGVSLTQANEQVVVTEELKSASEERYSLEECEQIGKAVMNTIQSELELYFYKLNIKNVEDPHIKAWKYLEEKRALQMLEILLSKLVFKRPDDPISCMIEEVTKMMDEKGIIPMEQPSTETTSKDDEDTQQ